ncbi:MAG: ankyrin repeat domain-containing protein, partial [Deltaproteobacteria bacterium]|nr:ankyrin repeat domain-containing protein [Deltaproteobacteria bacterium]
MRFSAVKHLPLLVFFLALLGCGNPQEEATRQLGQMDIKFTEDSFVERARDGNIAAVKLFLQAGMKPNVTSAAGETPLLVAVQFGRQDVVEALLAQG